MLLVNPPTVESRLARAAMYVRSHIDERISLEVIANVAGFSPYHFHRVFRVAFGENVNAYVTRHRLQRAAYELRTSSRSITEIGLRCGYESPSAFGRAFARAFDATPSAYRAAGGTAPLPASGLLPTPRDIPDPRFETYAVRPALAIRHVGPYDQFAGAFRRVYEIGWRRGFLPGARMVGLSYDSPDLEDHETLRGDACLTLIPGADVAGARADGMRDIELPGGAYAVYRHRGPYERITHAFDVLVAAWVLTGRIELRAAPFLEAYYSDPTTVAPADLECDLAIPIQ
jgi:AraC family transcriptional regulator